MLVISLVAEPVRLVWSDLFELLQVFFNRVRSLFVCRRGNGLFPARGAVVISLRYHIVSLVAVFLALALGIVVGSTVLQDGLGPARHQRAGPPAERAQQPRERRPQAGDLPPAELRHHRPARAGPGPAQGPLGGAGRHDKVDSGMRDAVRKVLEDAGARVDGQITFADDRLALGAEADRTALARLLAVEDGRHRRGAPRRAGQQAGRVLATSTALPQEDARRLDMSPASRTPTSSPTRSCPSPGLRD